MQATSDQKPRIILIDFGGVAIGGANRRGFGVFVTRGHSVDDFATFTAPLDVTRQGIARRARRAVMANGAWTIVRPIRTRVADAVDLLHAYTHHSDGSQCNGQPGCKATGDDLRAERYSRSIALINDARVSS
jgi:hypothetical protein